MVRLAVAVVLLSGAMLGVSGLPVLEAETGGNDLAFVLSNLTALWEEVRDIREEVAHHLHHGHGDSFQQVFREMDKMKHEHDVHHLYHPDDHHNDHHDPGLLQHLEEDHTHSSHDHNHSNHEHNHSGHDHSDHDHGHSGHDHNHSKHEHNHSGHDHSGEDNQSTEEDDVHSGENQDRDDDDDHQHHHHHSQKDHDHLRRDHSGGSHHHHHDHSGGSHDHAGSHHHHHNHSGGSHPHHGSRDVHDRHGFHARDGGHHKEGEAAPARPVLPPRLGLALIPGRGGGVVQEQDPWEHASCNVLPNADLPGGTVNGTVILSRKKDGSSPVYLVLNLSGFDTSQGRVHGFHIHANPVTGNSCGTAGGHLNPFGVNHGGPDSVHRHVGDLGNIEVDLEGKLTDYVITDDNVTFQGDAGIVGKSIVIHAGEDDLGQGGDAGSLATGNAGGRLACCNIHIQAMVHYRFKG